MVGNCLLHRINSFPFKTSVQPYTPTELEQGQTPTEKVFYVHVEQWVSQENNKFTTACSFPHIDLIKMWEGSYWHSYREKSGLFSMDNL